MKTTRLGIANYCGPCHAYCRYCLLCSCGQVSGVEYHRSTQFAHRVFAEIAENCADISTFFYIGYSMDIPELKNYIRFCNAHHSPSAHFLQMNGFQFRKETEMKSIMHMIHEEGVNAIDLTFFGTEEYHDRFAGRKGDYQQLMQMLSIACQIGIPVDISIPLLKDNLNQTIELRDKLQNYKNIKYTYFLPNDKGRGRSVCDGT